MNSNWLAGQGQFIILGVSWGSIALFYLSLSWRMGRTSGSETDGCLLMICNFIFVIVGGMTGLLIFHFPFNLVSSMFLALTLPTAITLGWLKKNLDKGKRG